MFKVCHMTSVHKTKDTRIFYKQCVSLANAGYETYLITRGNSSDENGVHIIGLGEIPSSRRKRMTITCKQIYQIALDINADIYHFHDPELIPCGLKLKKRGKHVLFDSHEDTVSQIIEKEWIPKFLRKIFSCLFSWYLKKACEKLDGVISVTPHLCDEFMKINKNTIMVTNYPLVDNVSRMIPSFQNNYLVFAGGISPQWCHEAIINAIEDIDDLSYVLCGFASDGYLQLLKKLNGWEKVQYLGKLPFTQVGEVLAGCNIGMAILQYNRNTGGNLGTLGNTKIFEYMLSGLPIICTDFILWKNIIDTHQCGLYVNPYNISEIRTAISYLLQNPQEAKQMGENGRKAILEQYNWLTEEKKLLSFYQSILK